jgi:glucose-1-phosphate cytidylyltransferase
MKTYVCYGHGEFFVAVGYKADVVRDYFFNYHPTVAGGLDCVLSDYALAERLGENGRELVRRKFTWDAALE